MISERVEVPMVFPCPQRIPPPQDSSFLGILPGPHCDHCSFSGTKEKSQGGWAPRSSLPAKWVKGWAE